jgi:uncharacterized protein (TIGR02466 family)|tara:strand:+ start:834 stop:1430 length:597 start_codon:yes stop_codon:yes gene_type:complete
MKSNTWNLFPTPVTRFTEVFTAQQLQDINQYLSTLRSGPHSAIDGDGVSSHDETTDIIKSITSSVPGCQDFSDTIQHMLNEYTYTYGLDPVEVTNSWYSVQRPGSRLVTHLHANSIVSCVIYTQTDSDSSRIYFDNPNKMVAYCNQTSHPTDYNFEYFYIQPEVGDVLMFPSWLTHGSKSEHNQSQQRTILSFNARYK